MNKILKISLLVFFATATTFCFAQRGHGAAQAQTTSVTVASDHQNFWLFIDEVLQNERSVRSIRVQSIPMGEHFIRVEIDNTDHNTVGQLIQLRPAHNSYWVVEQRNMYGITVGGEIPRTETTMAFVQTQQSQPYASGGQHPYRPGRPNPQQPTPPQQTPPQAPQHPQGPTPPQVPNPPHGAQQPHHPAGQPAPACMNDNDFNAALATIRSENLENTKLSTAKQIIASNMLNIRQIEQICQLFSFENTKLEFAKSAYHRCTEQNKYYLLHSVFQFENSKTELDRYVQQQQQRR